jgi:hypothetical protein
MIFVFDKNNNSITTSKMKRFMFNKSKIRIKISHRNAVLLLNKSHSIEIDFKK